MRDLLKTNKPTNQNMQSENIWRSHLFPPQLYSCLVEKKKKSTAYHSYFSSWGIKQLYLNIRIYLQVIHPEEVWRFWFYLTSHSYDNAMQVATNISYNTVPAALKYNSLHNNRSTVNYLEEHSKDVQAFPP